jgi:hypothetical protein
MKNQTQPWISVSEQLPSGEDGIYQLIYGEDEDGDKDMYIAYLAGDRKTWYYRSTEFSNVTHWMPLPEIPKQLHSLKQFSASK